MAHPLDYKRLYDVNQWLKNDPYWYDFKDGHFIGADEQSDVYIEPKGFKIDNPSGKRFLSIPNGKVLYAFIAEHKKGKEEKESVITSKEISLAGHSFPVSYTDSFPPQRLTDVPISQLEEHDCSAMSLWYEGEMLKDGKILIGDIIDILDHKKSLVQNEFVFLEIKGDEVHLFNSKLGLSLRNKTLICLNNFVKLKTKKKDNTEFLMLHSGGNRLYVHYGNAEYDVCYQFHLFDLHKYTTKKG